MINVMIVDDMPIFLEYLKGCIDWESYGFHICSEARNGKEALEKIAEVYPDVVLTDITMPYIDGLELSEIIRRDYPDISVILITGNNEFEYAKKAVRIGVCDYIVKPFEKEELVLSMLKLSDNIDKAVESRRAAELLKLQQDEEAARKIIYTSETGALAQLGLSQQYFLVCGISFSMEAEGARLEQVMNWETLIAGLLKEMIQMDGDYTVFHDYENNIVVLLNFATYEEMRAYKGYELTDLITVIHNQLGIDCTIAISGECPAPQYIRNAYYQVLQTLAVKGAGQVWDNRRKDYNRAARTGANTFYTLEMVRELNSDLETLQEERVRKTITAAWNAIASSDRFDFNLANLASGLLSILMSNIISSGLSVSAIYGKDFYPEQIISSAASYEEKRNALIRMYEQRIQFEKGRKGTKAHDIAAGAIDYISQHYSNSAMSMGDISTALMINQTYLRRMFKEETGKTLSEYITAYRMQKARELITTSGRKLVEVAELVGYNDVSYFSNCFKKHYGISPSQLRPA